MAEPASDSWELMLGTSAAAQADDLESLADEELLRRYRDRRRADAFAEMVRRHQPMVFRTCMRIVGSNHDAEDATQSVFLVLAQRPQVVRQSLVGCLHELARAATAELCRSRRRRQQREEMAARIKSLFRRLCGGPPLMENQELREELDVALAQLPDAQRQAVILHYLEGLSQQEAARQAGCTQVTLGWRAMKGVERLRTILGRRGVVLAPATLAALLTTEGQAAAALTPGSAATTATAAQVAASLMRRFGWGAALRKVALVAVLATAAVGLGAGLVLLPQAKKDAPPRAVKKKAAAKPAPVVAPVLGAFDRSLDIGGPARAGAARRAGDAYTVQGGGRHIYGDADQFRFVCRPWTGDGEIIARVASDPDQDARQVAAGVMFRDRLTAGSHHVAVLLTSTECHVKFRTPAHPGSGCDISRRSAAGKHWVRLVRRGNTFAAYIRPSETQAWKLVKEVALPLKPSLFVGLAVTAHDDAQLATATFDRVSVRNRPGR
jgi:RNA polymerase sigma factor (sigma-70 family)